MSAKRHHKRLARLIGVIHLPPLAGSPHPWSSIASTLESAAEDARSLQDAGFEGVIVENFGDAPFFPGQVPAETVAAMTRCVAAVAEAAPRLRLGVNVLRNDADAALAIAAATNAEMIRVNVHMGARVTDQGVVQGQAHDTLRKRCWLQLEAQVAMLCDVEVKHSAALSPRPLSEQAAELADRGLADAVLVTGKATASAVSPEDLRTVCEVVEVPVFVASGVTADTLGDYAQAHGFIVGSCLRADGRPGGRIDPQRAAAFSAAFSKARG